jgi:hypothetical protein
MRADLNSYRSYFASLPLDRLRQLQGRVFAAVQRNGDWEIIAVENDEPSLRSRLATLGVDANLVVRDELSPPQFYNGGA